METTMLHRYHNAARLRFLSLNPPKGLDPVLLGTLATLRDATVTKSKGSLLTDIPSTPKASKSDTRDASASTRRIELTNEEANILNELLARGGHQGGISTKAVPRDWVEHLGVQFAPAHVSFDNSNIMYVGSASAAVLPGQIVNIFDHTRKSNNERVTETFVVVHRYIRADETEQKRYERLDNSFGAIVCTNDKFPRPVIIRLAQVLHHFASYSFSTVVEGIEEERLIAWPLDRVSKKVDHDENSVSDWPPQS